MTTKTKTNLQLTSSAVNLDQFRAPLAVFQSGVLSYANQTFYTLFPKQSNDLASIRENEAIAQVATEIAIIGESLSFDLEVGHKSYRCIGLPHQDDKQFMTVIFEDISDLVRNEKDNNLLYRLSLLLSSTDQPLKKTLEMTIDHILFELEAIDSSIMLFNKQTGLLEPTAWASTAITPARAGSQTFAIGQGIAGHAAKVLKPIAITNTFKDKRFFHSQTSLDPTALLCLPIHLSRELLGVLSLTRPVDSAFTEREVQLLTIVAGRLASLIKTHQSKEKEELQKELTEIIAESHHILEHYDTMSDHICRILNIDTCFIIEWDAEEQCIHLARSQGNTAITRPAFLELERLIHERILPKKLSSKAWISLDTLGVEVSPQLHHTVLFPVMVRKQLFGFLLAKNSLWERKFDPAELSLGQGIASQLAVALENAYANEQILDEQKKLQQIQNTLRDGLILYTPDMRVAMHNQAVARMFGLKKEIIGESWHKVLNEEMDAYCHYRFVRHFDANAFLTEAINHGKSSHGLATLETKPPRTIEVTVAPVYDRSNKLSGVLSHFRDITQIHDLQSKMAMRVQQLTNLFKISSVSGFNSQQIIHRILRLVPPLLSVQSAQLLLTSQTKKELIPLESTGDLALLKQLQDKIIRKSQRAIETNQAVAFTVKANHDTLPLHVLITPITGHHESCIGTLVVVEKESHSYFTREDINLLSIVSTQIASKLDTAWLLNQVEEDRNKLAAIIDQSVDGILVLDAEQTVQIWNQALERLTGIREQDVLYRHLDEVRGQVEIISRFTQEDVTELQIKNAKTGKNVWLGIGYSPIMHGKETTGYIAIIRDISRQKELEQSKNEFVSTASHELRSPITAIVGYLSMLKRGDAGQLVDKQQAFFVDKAYTNAKRMVSIIEDLLMTTRMETGQLRYQFEPMSLADIVDSVLSDVRFKAEEKNITIHCDKKHHVNVISDKDGLHQVVNNLITNAVKYTPPGGTVTIQFEQQIENDQPVLITKISDTGVGIEAADLERVFEKFARIDNPLSVSAGGTGLGLFITKGIVEELGGRIWVESQKDRGSTFALSLPIAKGRKKGAL